MTTQKRGATMAKFFDKKLLKFILVGIANTLFSAAIMFLLYNLAHFGYWGSSAVSYVLGSILSFFLNKNFTFQNKDSFWKTALRFTINVAVCYVIAYSLAKPLVIWALEGLALSQDLVEQITWASASLPFKKKKRSTASPPQNKNNKTAFRNGFERLFFRLNPAAGLWFDFRNFYGRSSSSQSPSAGFLFCCYST